MGESVDSGFLGYELGEWHLDVVAGGEGVDLLRGLASEFDKRLLLVRQKEGGVWAWLGPRRAPDGSEVHERIAARWPPGVPLSIATKELRQLRRRRPARVDAAG